MDALALVFALLSVRSPFDDLQRFPSHQTASLNFQFAEKTVKHLEKELTYSIDGERVAWVRYETPLAINSPERAHLKITLREASFCRDAWLWLSIANNPTMSDDHRREAQDGLRLLLGEASYFDGEMPPAAPWWRMREMR